MRFFKLLFYTCVCFLGISLFTHSERKVLGQAPPPNLPIVETWKFQGFALGPSVGNETPDGSLLMANVMTLGGGGYRMFYNKSTLGSDKIKYAESSDGVTWSSKGIVLQGSSNATDRTFILGGPSVVKLPDSRYRMYYRCSEQPQPNTPPKLHIRSAISTDGIHFTEEPGIRIDIVPYDSNSPFQLAGHGSFFMTPNGTYAGIFSGNPKNTNTPSDLILTTSTDGLTWGNFKTLYVGFHDPTVVKKDGKYYLYGMYLHYYHARAISTDGVTWPTQMDKIVLTDATGTDLTESRAGVGDLGAAIGPSGQIRLYTNHGNPSSNIAYFELSSSTGGDNPPSIKVLSPNGGERVQPGGSLSITWQSSDDKAISTHSVDLSLDGGQNYSLPLAAGLPGTAQSFTAALGVQLNTAKARVRVTATDTGQNSSSDASDGDFAIERNQPPPDTQPPAVKVLRPNGGEKFANGTSVTLIWQSSDDREIITHDVFLSNDGGVTFPTVLANGLPGTAQSFTFTLPANQPKTKAARIRVVAVDQAGNRGQDDSDGNFTIKKK